MVTEHLWSIIISICGVALAAVITLFGNRKQSKAVTLFNNTAAYSQMLHDFENRLAAQEEVVKNQARQIIDLQKANTQYLNTIKVHQKVEKELRKRIAQLEIEIKTLKLNYNHEKTA